jgi:predicted DNA-binding protein YlxM (UPF0122 family)
MAGMSLQEISDKTGTTKQNIQQTISRGVKKLYKNTRKTYKVSHVEALEMLIKGLGISDEMDIKYLFKNLDKNDKIKIQKEYIDNGMLRNI